jgi:oxygen-dependent protoporphyrinogen oxidase
MKADHVEHDVNGFGCLVPSVEGRRILGSIWTSSIFARRAPAGGVQLRTMIGGDGDHESLALSDAELIEFARKDLDAVIGLKGSPEVVRVYRWERGIPQFRIGHSEVMNRIESELERLGNLHVASNAYYGIGLNDCVKQAYRVAMRID